MNVLDGSASNELPPRDPPKGLLLLHEIPNDAADDRRTYGIKKEEGDGILLIVGFPHVGEDPERDTAAGGGQSTQKALRLMEIWKMNMMVKMSHFLHVGYE